jgi:hypothetical protein
LIAILKENLLYMSSQVTSKVVGQLVEDHKSPGSWVSKEVPVPFLDGEKLRVFFEDFDPVEDKEILAEADKALANFFALDNSYRESISHLVYKNCKDFLEATGFDEADQAMRDIKDEKEIWQFVHPTEIVVTPHPDDEYDMYVQVLCECDWEEEHGLQLVFHQGKKISRVSEQDGHLTDADAEGGSEEDNE